MEAMSSEMDKGKQGKEMNAFLHVIVFLCLPHIA